MKILLSSPSLSRGTTNILMEPDHLSGEYQIVGGWAWPSVLLGMDAPVGAVVVAAHRVDIERGPVVILASVLYASIGPVYDSDDRLIASGLSHWLNQRHAEVHFDMFYSREVGTTPNLFKGRVYECVSRGELQFEPVISPAPWDDPEQPVGAILSLQREGRLFVPAEAEGIREIFNAYRVGQMGAVNPPPLLNALFCAISGMLHYPWIDPGGGGPRLLSSWIEGLGLMDR